MARKFSTGTSMNSPALRYLAANHGMLAGDHGELAGEAAGVMRDQQPVLRRTRQHDVQAARQDE